MLGIRSLSRPGVVCQCSVGAEGGRKKKERANEQGCKCDGEKEKRPRYRKFLALDHT